MTFRRLPAALVLATFVLTACGGGGGSPAPNPTPKPTPSPTPSPTPTPTPPALTAYLPFANGNVWHFSSGGTITDTGSSTLSCSCAYSGGAIETHVFSSPTGAYAGTFYYAKASGLQGSGAPITYLVGISENEGQTIALAGPTVTANGTEPGLGIMDDDPSMGETFSDNGATATITSVGQTATYGSTTYQNVATTAITGGSAPAIDFAFIRGIGYGAITDDGLTVTLASYSVSATSMATSAHAPRVLRAAVSAAPAGAAIRAILSRSIRR